jgi:hypothetical protein
MQENESLEKAVLDSFFGTQMNMQNSIAVLCDSIHNDNTKTTRGKGTTCPATDPVTQTVLMILSSTIHIQMTVVGWQPLKGRDLTFPFHLMSLEQKQALKNLIEGEPTRWNIYEHAMSYRRQSQSPLPTLSPLDVLEALCTSILASSVYQDKKLRVAVCNILLQRVQASIPIDKQTQAALNTRLFPPAE